MKVTLIYPNFPGHSPIIKSNSSVNTPVTLMVIAAYIRKYGYDVDIIDCNISNLNSKNIISKIDPECSVVGFTSMISTHKETELLIKAIKNSRPNIVTVLGGHHISTLPEQTLKEIKELDYGIICEGEIPFLNLLNYLSGPLKDIRELQSIGSLVYRDNFGKIIINDKEKLIENLDSLPFPSYDLIEISKYYPKPYHIFTKKIFKNYPFTFISTARGCIHNCDFCANSVMWGNSMRFYSAEYVVNLIEFLVKQYNISHIAIIDSSFLANKKRALEILNGIIEKNIYCNFVAQARVDEIDDLIIKKLKNARFHHLKIGVESCNNDILNSMNKGYSYEDISNTFKICNENDFEVGVNIIIGYPPENISTFKETLKRIIKLDPAYCVFWITFAIPGTNFAKKLPANIVMQSKNQMNWKMLSEQPVMQTKNFTTKELVSLRKHSYISFYCRPKKIISIIKNINSLKKFITLIEIAINYIFLIFNKKIQYLFNND